MKGLNYRVMPHGHDRHAYRIIRQAGLPRDLFSSGKPS